MSHPFTCKSKFETLHHEAEQLRNKRLKLQQSADKAKRKGEEIYESVDKWLIEAGKAIEEADEFIQGEEQAKKRCFVGLCPDLKTRYLLSKKAEKKALAIDKLVNEGDHDPISFRPRILQIVASSVYHREALNSRVLFLKQVMDALRDPNLNKIGVHGMGGVGKTTLAKEVHRQAIEEKLFDEVVMVAVNQTPEFRRIQSEKLSQQMKKAPPGIESRHKQILTADEPAFEEFLSEGEHGAQSSLFNRMVAFSNLENLHLGQMNDMKKSGNLEELFSCEGFTLVKNLKLFTVDNLKQIWDIDSRLKPVLQHLETLSVNRCNSLNQHCTIVSSFLNLASLEHLNSLLWHGGIQGRLFHNVQSLTVDQCAISDIPVPANLLQFLNKLEKLQVEYCDSAEIVFDLEGLSVDDGHTELLPQLSKLHLANLPMLRHLWNKDPLGILEFNNLRLHLKDRCAALQLSYAERKMAWPISIQELEALTKVAIPSLEELRVEYNTMKDMWSQADFLSGLKGIELTCFSNDSTLLPSYFFQSLPDLEKLVLSDASFEEIIFHEEIISEETRAGLVKLKELKLPRLKHLMDAKLLTVFQYLETLEVLECGRLEILVPSSVSFQNLKTLEVSNCQRLVNLISSSTARSLERLRKMKIEKCELIQEIIVTEADKDEEEEICFGQLKCLELQHLPSLSSFCSGVVTKLEDAYLGHEMDTKSTESGEASISV
ncbi:hypothetical protein GH714_012091 [Hevea brasiliensis]|uniref:Uncharacterized protein n=1 Tax=Hevea brasiliensis TaxID=3981 RepID=A0A6A6KZM0_HEVBR|nr:hypothetical protein GH714_012091 [Hevea brasiliensis]